MSVMALLHPAPQPPLPLAATQLLAKARESLGAAGGAQGAEDRYLCAHLAALRAAAAVLAVRGRPARGRALNVWVVLPRVAPELGEWAAFFAAGASRRAAIEAGLRPAITMRQADDLIRDAGAFVDTVAALLGIGSLPPQAS